MEHVKRMGALALLAAVSFGASMAFGCDDMVSEVSGRVDGHGITNGTPTSYAEWTGAAGLIIGSSTLCTGTFVDPEVVLTAAHCVHLDEAGVHFVGRPAQIEIVGGPNALSPSIAYGVGGEIAVHPTWTGKAADVPNAVDAALIRLSAPPVDTPEIYPVRDDTPALGEKGWLVGYGNSTTSSGLGTHRKGQSTVLSYYGFGSTYLELGDPSGTCTGDSGGPFFTEVDGTWAVTGITSFGATMDGSCDPMRLNLSTNVPPIYDWVADQVLAWTGRDVGVPEGGDADTDTDTDTDSDSDSDADGDGGGDSDGGDDEPDRDRSDVSCSISRVGAVRDRQLSSLLAAAL